MSNILKVTTPTVGYDTAKTNPITPNDKQIHNIADPSRVPRPDGATQNNANQNNKFNFTHESNFDKFLQLIKNTPSLTESLTEMMFLKFGTMVTSGIDKDFAMQISQFMELIKMSESDLLNFLKTQAALSSKFKGPFFDMLRNALIGSKSGTMKTDILEFLKAYNNTVSNEHILGNIMTNLKNIQGSMPRSHANNLLELINKMSIGGTSDNSKTNTVILKEEILPFLSKYVKSTHDFGITRDFITMLTLNIAQYENGSKENYDNAFETLLRYNTIAEKLEGVDLNLLKSSLLDKNFKDYDTIFMDKLINIIEKGINGEAGYENKTVFENILKSFLVNESVYMPLLHVMLPVNVDGNMFFSEIWIDPDSENSSKDEGSSSGEKTVKIFIKFDIKDVGFFEVVLVSKNNKVDLQLFYPESLAPMEKGIKSQISTIMAKNGLNFNTLALGKSGKPIAVSDVFPQIYERRNSVNVKI